LKLDLFSNTRGLAAQGMIFELSTRAVVLVVAAAFHATGYQAVGDTVATSAISPFFRRAIPGIWLFFSWHLVALAFGLG
jgi:hypothetical protein